MGNGMPISAIVGKSKYMCKMDKIFFHQRLEEKACIKGSIATLKKLIKNNVPKKLYELGSYLDEGVSKTLKKYNLEETITYEGHPCWKIMKVKDRNNIKSNIIKTLLIKNLISKVLYKC